MSEQDLNFYKTEYENWRATAKILAHKASYLYGGSSADQFLVEAYEEATGENIQDESVPVTYDPVTDSYYIFDASKDLSISQQLRILYCPTDELKPCGCCLICRSADEIDCLQKAIDSIIDETHSSHQPMWANDEAKENGKKPYGCTMCHPQESGWPCTHRVILDELRAVRGRL